VSLFLENAQRLFETAEVFSRTGGASEMTILVGRDGVRMLSESDWALDRLLDDSGAQMAFRVSERGGAVRLEGRSGTTACRLESESPQVVARRLLHCRSLPAGWAPLLPAASRR
jgi:hypothetical protein